MQDDGAEVGPGRVQLRPRWWTFLYCLFEHGSVPDRRAAAAPNMRLGSVAYILFEAVGAA
jgi:hypothetical protein